MIIVECYADEAFLAQLGISRNKIRHEAGVGKVLEKLEKDHGTAGMIDEDPGKSRPREIRNYIIEKDRPDHSMMVHKEKNVHLLVLKPDLEGWLVNKARSLKVNMTDFNLPDDPDRLHSRPRYDRELGFGKLIRELMKKDDSISQLVEWLDTCG
ncbi:MAG: hypothetical protein DRN37_08890 [Thermoplasmata archaeon]|nr:MAG: hypothetical protein B6U90_04665 [Thermoplasmatales archaeon ex4484_6]RLF55716.1 MAG: hypothetical protein DRN37_08890 [Thermoplasmata archaeon]RLF65898.1 MAG: hypothetical protein DRN57_08185 [Thermoplasmata archaeon]